MQITKGAFLISAGISISALCPAQQKNIPAASDKKSNWVAGISLGNVFINGDVRSEKAQLCGGISIARPLTKWFALQLNFTHGNAKGLNAISNQNFAKNPAWSAAYAAPVRQNNGVIANGYMNNGIFTAAATSTPDPVYYNYKTSLNEISLLGKFTLNIPSSNPVIGLSLSLGAGALFYNANVNTGDANGTYAALFKDLNNAAYGGTKETLSTLKNRMDKSYETAAEKYTKPVHFSQSFGFGMAYHISRKYMIELSKSMTFIKSDLLDGQRWQEHAYGDAVLTRDFDYINYTKLSISYLF